MIPGDTDADAAKIAGKIDNLRVFPGAGGKPDRDLHDINDAVLLVFQFTLFADTKKGRHASRLDTEDWERG